MSFDKDLLFNLKKLEREFYLKPVVKVARNLLGKIFVKLERNTVLAGMITEVEAYDGKSDQASHSYKGLNRRNQHMFYLGGHTYVYFTYGVHYCLNVVACQEGYGAAVLIRAMEPLLGVEKFSYRRFNKRKLSEKEFQNLLNGPGKICQAFNLTTKQSGKDLLGNEMFILDYKNLSNKKIGCSQRIGISKSKELMWRFYIIDSKFLSK